MKFIESCYWNQCPSNAKFTFQQESVISFGERWEKIIAFLLRQSSTTTLSGCTARTTRSTSADDLGEIWEVPTSQIISGSTNSDLHGGTGPNWLFSISNRVPLSAKSSSSGNFPAILARDSCEISVRKSKSDGGGFMETFKGLTALLAWRVGVRVKIGIGVRRSHSMKNDWELSRVELWKGKRKLKFHCPCNYASAYTEDKTKLRSQTNETKGGDFTSTSKYLLSDPLLGLEIEPLSHHHMIFVTKPKRWWFQLPLWWFKLNWDELLHRVQVPLDKILPFLKAWERATHTHTHRWSEKSIGIKFNPHNAHTTSLFTTALNGDMNESNPTTSTTFNM